MEFGVALGTAVLERPPRTLHAMLGGLGPAWVDATEGPETRSPYAIVRHLIHGECTSWVPRAQLILAQGPNRRFTTVARVAPFRESESESLDDLRGEFAAVMLRRSLASWVGARTCPS